MIQSILKMAEIMDQLMRANGPLGMNDLAKLLSMPKTTVFRFIITMEAIGFVRRDSFEPGKFYLGIRLFSIGSKAFEELGLRKIAIPHMEALRDILNESVLLTALEETRTIYLDKIQCHQAVVIQTKLGGTPPSHCVASGKAMLAYHPKLIEQIIGEGLPKYTKFTITDPNRFREECAKIRKLGYALDNDEFRDGVTGIGAPIFNAVGEAFAAISIAVPTTRINSKRIKEIIDAVIQTTDRISHEFGAENLDRRKRRTS